MRFEIVSIFPEFFDQCFIGLLDKARREGKISVDAMSPREFATDKHRTIDDTPYGGGSGMVMMPGPIVDALETFDERRGDIPTKRILLTPQGKRFDQKTAEQWSTLPALTFVCGRYEGFDERVRKYVDEEVSLGDFVLLGGELAATTMIAATARLLPGVVGNSDSPIYDSHSTGLLEHPQYTRPAEYRGDGIPEVLLSGHHKRIDDWRRRQAILRTATRRPDMLDDAPLSDAERAWLESQR